MSDVQFVIELGKAMHALGSPSFRVEDAMAACARHLGLQGSFFSVPTGIFVELQRPDGGPPQARLIRAQPGTHDLGKLALVYRIRDEVTQGRTDPQQGLLRLHEVMTAPPAMPGWLELPARAAASAAAVVFLGGGLVEVAVAAAIGLLLGLCSLLVRPGTALDRAFEPLACVLASALAHLGARWALPLDASMVTLGAIIVMLPGYTFTTALGELAMKHLASGSARILGALGTLLNMAVCTAIGTQLVALATGPAPAAPAPVPLPPWAMYVALPCFAFASAVLLRAKSNQLLWVALAVAAAWLGLQLGNGTVGPELAAFTGAMGVTVLGNLYARWRRRPSAVVRTPGLLLLVPGSLGFRGIAAAIHPGAGTDMGTLGGLMLMVGGAIVAGVLIATLLVPLPRDVEPES
ncbi:MAG: hypothetical protein RL148_515 [Planctomycetota bacterium]